MVDRAQRLERGPRAGGSRTGYLQHQAVRGNELDRLHRGRECWQLQPSGIHRLQPAAGAAAATRHQMLRSQMNSKCYQCGENAIPQFTVTGPNHDLPVAKTRHFCCTQCFWVWVERVIRDRDLGGRLDRKVNWD